ncbi:hypothetical protein GXB80_02860 [Paenibacillus polymyxa]|nr:hypothetical protein [Paenibacillus polymyxa]
MGDFKAGSERSRPFESGEAAVFAFAVGFLPISVLSIQESHRNGDRKIKWTA